MFVNIGCTCKGKFMPEIQVHILGQLPKKRMKLKLKGLGTIIKRTFKGWSEDDPFRQSAVIAYYAIFSLPALLVLIINIAGFFFGKEQVSGEIFRQVEASLGAETARQVSDLVTKAGSVEAGVWSTVIAIATIIFGATGVF